MWSKRDSDNLDSIARSFEKLVERELERNLYPELNLPETDQPFFNRIKKIIKDKEQKIKVSEGFSTEDEALEEDIKTTQRIQTKIAEAHRSGNTPFFTEALLEEDELELL